MTTLSQFFPSGGGAGNETPAGIKIPSQGVPVHILGVAGGGGGPLAGAGAVFHATNYGVQPGSTVPITIGAGGIPAQCPCGQGGGGGTTSFNYPLLPLSVAGGGGGGVCVDGCPGGNGAGGGRCIPCGRSGGEGYYFKNTTVICGAASACRVGCTCAPDYVWLETSAAAVQTAEGEQYPWGTKNGYPGRDSSATWSPACSSAINYNPGEGGKSGRNATFMSPGAPFTCPTNRFCVCIASQGYNSGIAGTMTEYNSFGTWGSVICDCGRSGGLIIQWATGFGAAPPTGFPGATDISPQTPGYYTYCFTSSGSITLS